MHVSKKVSNASFANTISLKLILKMSKLLELHNIDLNQYQNKTYEIFI